MQLNTGTGLKMLNVRLFQPDHFFHLIQLFLLLLQENLQIQGNTQRWFHFPTPPTRVAMDALVSMETRVAMVTENAVSLPEITERHVEVKDVV